MSASKLLLYLEEIRAPFLTAAVAPVLVGTAAAYAETGRFDGGVFVLALAGMALMHAGANVANDYFDHRSGNDAANTEFARPFTGGSRMIQRGLLSPREVAMLAVACFALAVPAAVCLILRGGWPIASLAAGGAMLGILYSAPPVHLASRGVGELAVAAAFGPLPVAGSYYLQTGGVSPGALLASAPVAMLIAAVLLINGFQDARADAAVGKRTLVVRLGKARAARAFSGLMTLWVAPIAIGILMGLFPAWAWLALVPVVFGLAGARAACRYAEDAPQLVSANKLAILAHALMGLLLSAGLALGRWAGMP